ncbi:hypothetical protein L2E82_05900 [Cichorium intybus]|uniref:Uncharacterized protein n=1 Tax=Cichorium intybus TaxID=13427 RepID=A0ACB9H9P1_CICIN|nr:hypothetical protein L2E82_05900 [Cichorium intybus]
MVLRDDTGTAVTDESSRCRGTISSTKETEEVERMNSYESNMVEGSTFVPKEQEDYDSSDDSYFMVVVETLVEEIEVDMAVLHYTIDLDAKLVGFQHAN